MHAIYRWAKGNEMMRPLAPFMLMPHTCLSFHTHSFVSEFRSALLNVAERSKCRTKITTADVHNDDAAFLAAA